MIDDCFTMIASQMDGLKVAATDVNLTAAPFRPIEDEMSLLERYLTRTPKGYGAFPIEKFGWRKMHKPKEGSYCGIPLRVGISQLHVLDKQARVYPHAIALMYWGGIETLDLGGPGAKAHIIAIAACVCLLENGVIGATYTQSSQQKSLVACFYPVGQSGNGVHSYPQSRQAILHAFQDKASLGDSDIDSNEFRAIQDLVILCATTFERDSGVFHMGASPNQRND